MQENETREQDGFGKYDELKTDDRIAQFEEKPYVASMPERTERVKKVVKDIFSSIFLIVILISMAVWCFWSGIKGLWLATSHPMDEVFTNMVKGDVYEGEISWASKEYCELKHTINLIPAGTEHFYLMYSHEMDKVIVLRAPKGWDQDFSNDLLNQSSLQERGIIRRLDYKMQQEVSEIVSTFGEKGIQMEPELYLDIMVDKMCCIQIFAGLSIILCSIYFTAFAKRQEKMKGSAVFCGPILLGMTVLFFITLCMLIYLLNMAK